MGIDAEGFLIVQTNGSWHVASWPRQLPRQALMSKYDMLDEVFDDLEGRLALPVLVGSSSQDDARRLAKKFQPEYARMDVFTGERVEVIEDLEVCYNDTTKSPSYQFFFGHGIVGFARALLGAIGEHMDHIDGNDYEENTNNQSMNKSGSLNLSHFWSDYNYGGLLVSGLRLALGMSALTRNSVTHHFKIRSEGQSLFMETLGDDTLLVGSIEINFLAPCEAVLVWLFDGDAPSEDALDACTAKTFSAVGEETVCHNLGAQTVQSVVVRVIPKVPVSLRAFAPFLPSSCGDPWSGQRAWFFLTAMALRRHLPRAAVSLIIDFGRLALPLHNVGIGVSHDSMNWDDLQWTYQDVDRTTTLQPTQEADLKHVVQELQRYHCPVKLPVWCRSQD